MEDQSDDSPFQKLGLKVLVSSGGNSVVILEKLWKEFLKFPRKDQLSLAKWMKIWCDGGLHLPPERYKMLGKFGEYRVDEFKSYQSRVYGTIASNWSGRTFVVTALDTKKSDGADPAVFKRVVRLATELKLER